MAVPFLAPVVAKHLHLGSDLPVLGDHHTAFAVGAQVLRIVEAKGCRVAEGAGPGALVLGAMGLAGVLDDREPVSTADGDHGVHIGGLAVEVDGHDGLRPRRDGSLDPRGVDGVANRVDVHEHRPGPTESDGLHRSEERVGNGDHLVAGANAHGPKRQVQGIVHDVSASGATVFLSSHLHLSDQRLNGCLIIPG